MGTTTTIERSVDARSWPILSLFSGAGGFDYGFRQAGFNPLLAIDINPAAIATYKRNHPNVLVKTMDLSKAAPEDILKLWEDTTGNEKPIGIIGGPPCQGFSSSNVRQTLDDPRHQLLCNYARIISAFATHYETDFFVLENVPGLAANKYRSLLDEFKTVVSNASFKVSDDILDAGTFGIAQHRRRLVAAGINQDRHPGIELMLSEGDCKPLHVGEVIKGFPKPVFCAKDLAKKNIPYHPNHVAMVPRSPKFTDGSLLPGNSQGLSFKVLAWDAPSYTVAYGHNEVHVHPDCLRRLSIYEAMRLQGFPRTYRLEGTFTEQVRLISDAVPPPFAEGIARNIAQTLGYQ